MSESLFQRDTVGAGVFATLGDIKYSMPIVIVIFNVLGLLAAFVMAPITSDSAFRVLSAGLCVCVMPGVAICQFLRIQVDGCFDLIALAVSFSLMLIALIAIAGFSIHISISACVAMLALSSIILSAINLKRGALGPIENTIKVFSGDSKWFEIGVLAIISIISIMAYRWAGDINQVAWEVSLNMFYTRNYVSGMPLDPVETSLRPDLAVANMIFLWEFILALISKVAGVDCLISSLRSRWLVPFLGFPSFYFMALHITGSAKYAKNVLIITLIASLSTFLFLEPNPLHVQQVVMPPYRRLIMSFLGSIHHGDTAMEILLPLLTGFLFMYLRGGKTKELLPLAGMLVVAFFWHPREYFQVMIYGFCAIISYGVLTLDFLKTEHLWRYFKLGGLFITVALSLFVAAKYSDPSNATISQEIQDKLLLIDGLLSSKWLILLSITMDELPPPIFSWEALCILLFIPILVAGRTEDAGFIRFLITLWFMTMMFRWTQYLFILLTYSEIFVTVPRFIFLFTYVVIGVGWYELVKIINGTLSKLFPGRDLSLCVVGIYGLIGFAFAILWRAEATKGFAITLKTLDYIFALSALAVLTIFNPKFPFYFKVSEMRSRIAKFDYVDTKTGAFYFIVFLMPISSYQFVTFINDNAFYRENVEAFFSDSDRDTGTGVSAEMIKYLREKVPPHSTITVDPPWNHQLGIYTSLRVFPVPQGNIAADQKYITLARLGKNPIFNPQAVEKGLINEGDVYSFIAMHKIDYIYAVNMYVRALTNLTEQYPDKYQIVFLSSNGADILVKVNAMGARDRHL